MGGFCKIERSIILHYAGVKARIVQSEYEVLRSVCIISKCNNLKKISFTAPIITIAPTATTDITRLFKTPT